MQRVTRKQNHRPVAILTNRIDDLPVNIIDNQTTPDQNEIDRISRQLLHQPRKHICPNLIWIEQNGKRLLPTGSTRAKSSQ